MNQLHLITANLTLSEGPVWSQELQALLFVDIECCQIYFYKDNCLRAIQMPDMVGCIVPIKNHLIAAAVRNRIYKIDLVTEKRDLILSFPVPPYLRFNDGKCDAQGRLWVGMMAADQSDPQAENGGSLYCVEQGKITAQYNQFTIPNGLAWNADGTVFYHIDTPTRKIDAYDVENGCLLKNKRTIASFDDGNGMPDGMCIDANGRLWVALWGGYGVVCIDPATGKQVTRIDLPDKNVSCCTFGGDQMNTLFITTAKDENGNGGSLWSLQTDVKGTAPNAYKE